MGNVLWTTTQWLRKRQGGDAGQRCVNSRWIPVDVSNRKPTP